MVFIEDHGFARNRRDILDEDELMNLFNWMTLHPDSGRIIPKSGGLRKLRWAASGKGKRGGARVIYYWWMADDRILLLDIYTKNEKENLSPKEINALKERIVE